MSEPIPESIPTSQDPKSRRPTKKRAMTPVSAQANQVEALFAHPEREVVIPLSATKEAAPKKLAPPPEIMANVQGSSAGAGSGEFHVYKASRRREYERLRLMDDETRKEKECEEFERRNQEWRQRDEAKTNKNKARREKAKARKMKAKTGAPMDVDVDEEGEGVKKDMETKSAVVARNGVQGPSRPLAADGPENEDALPVAEEAGVIIHDED